MNKTNTIINRILEVENFQNSVSFGLLKKFEQNITQMLEISSDQKKYKFWFFVSFTKMNLKSVTWVVRVWFEVR